MGNDNVLINQLSALGPDVQLRKRSLLKLASSITHWEVRELIACLNNIDFRTDIIARLPIELVLHIADYVDGTDILNCLNASKTWRLKWSQEDIAKRLSQRYLPRFWEYTLLKEKPTSMQQNMPRLFHEAVRRSHFRSQGKFASFFFHGPWTDQSWDSYIQLDPEFHPPRPDGRSPWMDVMNNPLSFPQQDHPSTTAMWYGDGRVAWQLDFPPPDDSLIIVDNLRTRLRRVFKVRGLLLRGNSASLEALGDKLVVALEDRILYVWHLETKEESKVTLPTLPQFVSTHGERVYAFAGMNDVYVLDFRGTLRMLDTSFARPPLSHELVPSWMDADTRTRHGAISFKLSDASPHPLLDDTVYIIGYMGEDVEDSTVLAVFELVNDKFSRSFVFDLSNDPEICLDSRKIMDCRKAGSRGLYGILSIWPNPDCENRCEFCSSDQRRAQLVCFDMLNACFSVQNYTVPCFGEESSHPENFDRTTCAGSWWNGQMTTWILGRHSFEPSLFLTTVRDRHVNLWKRPASAIPIYTRFCERLQQVKSVSEKLELNKQVDVQYVLDRGDSCPCMTAHSTDPDDALDGYQQFDGDDEFIVFFYRCGYAVWRFSCFGEL